MIDEECWPRFHLLVSIGGRLDSDSPHLLDFPLSSLTNGIDPYSWYSIVQGYMYLTPGTVCTYEYFGTPIYAGCTPYSGVRTPEGM